MIEGRHYQVAYITRDLEKSLTRLRERLKGVRQEMTYEAQLEVKTPEGLQPFQCNLALLWVEDCQYEIIQPTGGYVDMYRNELPEDDSLRFHHIAMRVDDWDEFRARVERQSLPVAVEGEAGPLKFLYLDGRSVFGHYLEYTYMPDEIWRMTGGR